MTRVATVTDAEAHLHEQVEHVPFGRQSAALILGACQVCGGLPGVSCLPGVQSSPQGQLARHRCNASGCIKRRCNASGCRWLSIRSTTGRSLQMRVLRLQVLLTSGVHTVSHKPCAGTAACQCESHMALPPANLNSAWLMARMRACTRACAGEHSHAHSAKSPASQNSITIAHSCAVARNSTYLPWATASDSAPSSGCVHSATAGAVHTLDAKQRIHRKPALCCASLPVDRTCMRRCTVRHARAAHPVPATMWQRVSSGADGDPDQPGPGADVTRASSVPAGADFTGASPVLNARVQQLQGVGPAVQVCEERARSGCSRRRGEPSPGAVVAAESPVLAQMQRPHPTMFGCRSLDIRPDMPCHVAITRRP